MLSTQLRGFVPALRTALNAFIWALRQLDGQVHSFNKARDMGVLPGSHTLNKKQLKKIHALLIQALGLLEGCLIISFLNPGMHHYCHYVFYTLSHGLLRWYWMFFFERCVCVCVCLVTMYIMTIT